MVTEIASEEEYVAVALYGNRGNGTAVSRCLKLLVEWFTDLGYPPNKIGVGSTKHVSKVVSFDRMANKIETGLDDISNFSLFSMKPAGRIPMTDSLLEATVTTQNPWCFAVVTVHSGIVTLDSPQMFSISQELIEQMGSEYGIGFSRPHRLGPASYAIGLVEGLGLSDEEDEEALVISKWSSSGMKQHIYREGILRDVYPWNFLNEAHLKYPVEGNPLAKWIAADQARGKLIAFPRGLVRWELDESHIPKVRRTLDSAGMIFKWQKPA